MKSERTREKSIIKTSILGIVANVFLSIIKGIIGIFSSSISIILDAVNNLTDALSSTVTILGVKLSSKTPDKKHPLGHGRIEYLSAMAVGVIILYAGITSLFESVKKILEPQEPEYNLASLFFVGFAVFVKVFMGLYTQKVGKKNNSDALVASGKDALFDAIISTSVLIGAIVYYFTKISLEAYLGAVISLFIIKSGVGMLMETSSLVLGERIDSSVAKAVKKTIVSFDDVLSAHDLVIHSYGPDKLVGSVHIEVSEKLDAKSIDTLERKIGDKVFSEHGIVMTGISIYAKNESDAEIENLESGIRKILEKHPSVIEMHGFYVDKERKDVRFDMIIDFDTTNRDEVYGKTIAEIKSCYPDYTFDITLDVDISD